MTRDSVRALIGVVLACLVTAVAVAASTDYKYDALGRLRKVIYDDGKTTDYALDPAGNRTSVTTAATATAGVLQFSLANYSVTEGTANITINVTRTGGSAGTVGVSYSIANGTATSPGDFAAGTGSLSWGPGDATNKTFAVTINDDALVESAETVALALNTPTGGATIGAQSTATLTINDNDVPPAGTLQFSAPTFSVGESGPQATITITRANGTGGAVGMTFATVTGGTATAASDYTTTTGTRSWADGVGGSQTFTIPILEDTAVEGSETVNLQLSAPTGGATLGAQSTAVLTITDNDNPPAGTLAFVGTTTSVNENGTSVSMTVRRSGGSFGLVGLTYATANGSATAPADYTAAGTQLSWIDGDVADKTITIQIANDAVFEGPETFTVNLSAATGGATLGTSTFTVTINDTSAAPTFSINSLTIGEDAGTATLTITKSGSTAMTHAVSFATVDGTATAGSDYTAISPAQVATFAAGVTSQPVTVQLPGDTAFEGGNETFTVVLSVPTNGAVISSGTGTITLTDNDAAPAFAINNMSVNENAGTVTLTVTKTGSTSQTHQVSYASANGTATAGTGGDYQALGGVLTFGPGVTTQPITITLNDDTSFEGSTPETFTVALSGATGGATIAVPTGTVSLNDNDGAPSFSVASTSVTEGGIATVTVTKSGASALSHNVSYATADGTAVASDYTAASNTLTFAPGDTTKTFSVQTTSDSLYEQNQTFQVNLSNATGGASIGTPSATVTINDDDPAPTFSVTGATVSENAGASVTFTVTKNGATELTHNVTAATASGTAIDGQDFTGSAPTLVFAPGTTTNTVTVPIINDNVYELTEQFSMSLSNPTAGATIATGTATATINDVDNPPFFTISDATYLEDQGTVTLTVTKGGSTAVTHNVSFANGGGTATAGADYAAFSGALTFAPTDTTKTISIAITNDTTPEGSETISVPLSNPTNGAFLSLPNTGTLTILDNDSSNVIRIDDQSATISESFAPASGSYSLTASGDVLLNNVDIGDWITPKSGMANYQAMATSSSQTGGCTFGGTYGSWVSFSGGAVWSASLLTENTNVICSLLVSIRATANPSVVLDTATITFNLNTGL